MPFEACFFFFFRLELDPKIDVGMTPILVFCSAFGILFCGSVTTYAIDLRFVPTNLALARARFSPSCLRVDVQIEVVDLQAVHVYTISINGATCPVSRCFFFSIRLSLLYALDFQIRLCCVTLQVIPGTKIK